MKALFLILSLLCFKVSFAAPDDPTDRIPLPKVSQQIRSEMWAAFEREDLAHIKHMVEVRGIDPNFSVTGSSNLFHYPPNPLNYTKKKEAIFEYLVSKGVKVTKREIPPGEGNAPIDRALRGTDTNDEEQWFESVDVDYIKFLVRHGADINKGVYSWISGEWEPAWVNMPAGSGRKTLEYVYNELKPDWKGAGYPLVWTIDRYWEIEEWTEYAEDELGMTDFLHSGVAFYRYLEREYGFPYYYENEEEFNARISDLFR